MFTDAAVAHYLSKVERGPGCWVWHGALNYAGYGVQNMDGRQWRAPRIAWVIANGDIPAGLQIDHLCSNRACVNPAHLEVVTGRVNMQRWHARKTHCAQGHPWIAENIVRTGSRQWASCRICNERRWKAKLKGSDRSELARQRWARWTPEQRSAIGRKSAATRRLRMQAA